MGCDCKILPHASEGNSVKKIAYASVYELPLLLPSFVNALELGHHLHITLHSFIDFTWTSSLYQVIRHLHKVSNTIGLTLNYLNIIIL